jgi:hypothetical protein
MFRRVKYELLNGVLHAKNNPVNMNPIAYRTSINKNSRKKLARDSIGPTESEA